MNYGKRVYSIPRSSRKSTIKSNFCKKWAHLWNINRRLSISTPRNFLNYTRVTQNVLPHIFYLGQIWSERATLLLSCWLDMRRMGVTSIHELTGNETWIHHLSYKRNVNPFVFKTVSSTGKVMATVFWDMKGVILVNIPGKRITINSEAWSHFPEKTRDAHGASSITTRNARCPSLAR